MTIGIGAMGPQAGLAVFRALRAAERVGTGSIGGFAVFAAITADGRLLRAETQRGGTSTLFTEGEKTGPLPSTEIADAPCAAVISSGPDRPAPLIQFLAADAKVGLVTGHRLPNAFSVSGLPLNQAVLAEMNAGATAADALKTVLDENADRDVGMIALGPGCGLAARNSAFVSERPDLGSARRVRGEACVEVLHNAIAPHESLAALVADIALDVIAPLNTPTGAITVNAGTPLVASDQHRIIVDGDCVVQCIETDAHYLLSGRWNCAALYLGAPIIMDGCIIGHTIAEPNVVVEEGAVVTLSGKQQFSIPFSAPAREKK
ncbi:hypothetical protein FJU08_20730 [Martelella alba]|uniref:Uncharacterized protein n=1 Tax=Martelella alba TaxID=2590451 RepID=A0A506U153_9HYPH|nr:hypothetical protein [Martelella alba]TPW27216.1 hypothetical protein FJU08_20730 [Martelella alba]